MASFIFMRLSGITCFGPKNRGRQYLIGVLGLLIFGIGIELAQEASNHFFRKKNTWQFRHRGYPIQPFGNWT